MKNKILMIIPSFYPTVGGAERQLMGLSSDLAGNGIDIDIVTRMIDSSPRLERLDGYSIIRLFSRIPKIGFLIQLLFFIFRSHAQYSVIHVHTLNSPAILAALLGKFFDIPVLVKVTRSGRGSQLSRYTQSIFGKIIFYILKLNSYFVAITPDVHTELLAANVKDDKIFLIPNGVVQQQLLKKNTEIMQVIFLGRLIPRKRVDLLMRAFGKIVKLQRCELLIIGDGPERGGLEKISTELNIEDSCRFLGSLSHSESLQILLRSHIFVLPSDSEGMSNALLEAMAAGNAVIAADIPANHALIQNNINGLLFHDTASLEEHLEQTINSIDHLRLLGLNAKKSIDSTFSFSVISRAYLNAYDKLNGTLIDKN